MNDKADKCSGSNFLVDDMRVNEANAGQVLEPVSPEPVTTLSPFIDPLRRLG